MSKATKQVNVFAGVSSASMVKAGAAIDTAAGTLTALAIKAGAAMAKANPPLTAQTPDLTKAINARVRSYFAAEIGQKAADGEVPGLDNAIRALSRALVIFASGDKISPHVTFREFVAKAKDARTALGIGRKSAAPAIKGAPDQTLTGEPATPTLSEAADYFASLRDSTPEVRTQVATWLLRHMSVDARSALLLSLQAPAAGDTKPRGKRAPRPATTPAVMRELAQ
jgi:hypothetical protein